MFSDNVSHVSSTYQFTAVDECNMGIFIEPVEWMKEQILMLEGKLSCPKCKGKCLISSQATEGIENEEEVKSPTLPDF